MRLRKQVIPFIVLTIVLALVIPVVGAQTGSVSVDGSPALFVFAQSSGLAFADFTPTDVIVNISGEETAFAALCADTLDIASSTRPISDEELALCQDSGVQWVELLIALDGLVVYSSDPDTTCLTLDDLATLYGEEGPAVYGRGREYQQFFMQTVGLDTMRDDFLAASDDLNTLAGLTQAEDSVAYVSLAGGLASGLSAVEIDGGEGCVALSAAAVSDGTYPLGRRLFMYVNIGSGERINVAEFVDYLLSAENLSRLPGINLVPAQESVYALAANNWARRTSGRTFSAPQVADDMTIEGADLTLIDGVTELGAAMRSVTETISGDNDELAYEISINGSERALARLCNAEVDLASTRRPITNVEMAACADSNVEFIEMLVGLNPIVVVTNAANDFATCLSMNQIGLVFGADNAGIIERWEQLQDGFPPFALSIRTPLAPASVAFAEMMGPTRSDVLAGDVAAGIGDNDYTIGYMSYGEYLAAGDAVRAVQINAGAGCVTPTAGNIQSGTYPLTQPLYLYANAESALRPAVQLAARELLASEAVGEAGFLSPSVTDLALSMDALRTGATGPIQSR